MERGSNPEPRASEEDALSTPPTPSGQGWVSIILSFHHTQLFYIEKLSAMQKIFVTGFRSSSEEDSENHSMRSYNLS